MTIWFLLFPHGLQAQTKIPVEVEHSGSDHIGQRVSYQLKERIRKSSGLRLTTPKETRLKIVIVSIDSGSSPGYTSSLGWVILLSAPKSLDIYLHSGVQVCGSSRINDVSERIVALIDNQADFFRKYEAKP